MESPESIYLKMCTDEEFEKAIHPNVFESLKKDGFAQYVGKDYSYFVMDNNKHFNEPPKNGEISKVEPHTRNGRALSESSQSDSESSIRSQHNHFPLLLGSTTPRENGAASASKLMCYTHGICGRAPSDNTNVLCDDCFKIFVRNNTLVVDLFDEAVCDDCESVSRTIRIRVTDRQLCVPCFKSSFERNRQKREKEENDRSQNIQSFCTGVAGIVALLTGNVKSENAQHHRKEK